MWPLTLPRGGRRKKWGGFRSTSLLKNVNATMWSARWCLWVWFGDDVNETYHLRPYKALDPLQMVIIRIRICLINQQCCSVWAPVGEVLINWITKIRPDNISGKATGNSPWIRRLSGLTRKLRFCAVKNCFWIDAPSQRLMHMFDSELGCPR